MVSSKSFWVFVIGCLTAISGFSISYTPQSRGRKLFGGYRIVPKVCNPTNPSRIKSDEPAICMFNYECSRRNGEVVGACMDGFLFGACCKLPPRGSQTSSIQTNSSPSTENLLNLYDIDHVPDVPILLNPDGSPIGMTSSDASGVTTIDTYSSSNQLTNFGGSYTKISTLNSDSSSQRPSTVVSHHMGDIMENAEKPQIPPQVDVSHLESDFPALLGQQQVLNDLRLPGLITHSDSNNDIQDQHQETSDPVNPITTLLSPDQILQIADPVDQLPALFAQGLGQSNHTGADTILLNENGTVLDEKHNPDELFKPAAGSSSNAADNKHTEDTNNDKTSINMNHHDANIASTTSGFSPSDEKTHITPMVQHYANTHRITGTTSGVKYTIAAISTTSDARIPVSIINSAQNSQNDKDWNSDTTMLKMDVTTPMSSTDSDGDEGGLVRVPTITYDVQSGNKKHDELDREEIAINHIISILNATTPTSTTRVTQLGPNGGSSIHTWMNLDETSKTPSATTSSGYRPAATTETFPYTFYKPARPTTYYHYDTAASTTKSNVDLSYSTSTSSSLPPNSYSTRKPPGTPSSYGSSTSYSYSSRPSTNPPAPTVIVLGPLGTEYTTVTTAKPATRRPTTGSIRPSLVTKLPSIGTTITHNISTVISTNNAVTSNNHVVSTSYISVNLKDKTSPRPEETVPIQEAVETDSQLLEDTTVTKRPSTVWTTLSSWSGKPSFHLKPSKPDFVWPESTQRPIHTVIFKETTVANKIETTGSTVETTSESTTASSSICDEDTPAPDDLINFPPVRNPALTQQEKPTLVQTFNDSALPDIEIVNENEIPTPSFIEDDVLTNKVDVFVNKIVESLQGNFQDLKDIVYNKKNVTVPAVTTKKPPTKKPVRPTPAKPAQQTTKRPGTKKPTRPSGAPQKPAGGEKPVVRPTRLTTQKPRPSSVTSQPTKRPQATATKRPKPTRKTTTSTTTTTTTTPSTTTIHEAIVEETEDSIATSTEISIESQDTTPDYRSECGVRPLIKRGRIVGGKGATFGEWPWQVLVREATWLGLFTKNKCGGVLITNNYVITAAHCQPGFLATLVAVFGEFDISGELESKRSVTRNVRRVVVNRGYNPATFENDLALLELEKPIQFDAHIVPICMPDDNADFTGRMATVTGWGRVKYNGGTPSVLQEVQVPIMENAVCQDMFRTAGHSKLILDSFLCAGYASGQKDSCEGDSGGPLMMERPDGRWTLVGTVSHGIKCAAPYLPGVYMRTTFFKPWLHSVTGV